MSKLYQIKNWNACYENAKSRDIKHKSWCAVPNKQDGLGYCRIMQHKNGPAIYGAFIASVLIASKQSKPREGYLTDTGGVEGIPLSENDISVITRIDVKIIKEMLTLISSPSVGWITAYDSEDTTRVAEGHQEGSSGASKKEGVEGVEGQDYGRDWVKVKEAWNKIASKSGLLPLTKITDGRKKHYNVRVEDAGSERDFWKVIYAEIPQLADWAKGKAERKWTVCFDWIIKNDTNFAKLAEGKLRKGKKQVSAI